jgi:hypothetical protein
MHFAVYISIIFFEASIQKYGLTNNLSLVNYFKCHKSVSNVSPMCCTCYVLKKKSFMKPQLAVISTKTQDSTDACILSRRAHVYWVLVLKKLICPGIRKSGKLTRI